MFVYHQVMLSDTAQSAAVGPQGTQYLAQNDAANLFEGLSRCELCSHLLQAAQSLLGLFVLGDVDQRADQPHRQRPPIIDCLAPHRRPAQGAIGPYDAMLKFELLERAQVTECRDQLMHPCPVIWMDQSELA